MGLCRQSGTAPFFFHSTRYPKRDESLTYTIGKTLTPLEVQNNTLVRQNFLPNGK